MTSRPARRLPSVAVAIASAAIILSAGIGAIPAGGAASPALLAAGAPVGGAPFSVSGSGFAQSTSLRLAVVPRGTYPTGSCFTGTPLSVADVTTDATGSFGTTIVWPYASQGTWTTLALQGACTSPTATLGPGKVPPSVSSASAAPRPSPSASSDAVVQATLDFDVGAGAASIPLLSKWGLLALVGFLAVAGWVVQARLRT